MATMSKRAQARTERELQDLLKVSGNSVCADCGARNPSWASWSIGVFLCMRCASLHRKLGTHISKVKSLSMDTWTNDQVENMRKNGNTAVNKIYNPRNKKPDMPFDVDEVDSAMERFIRKKYQEKSLSDGKPEVPSRDEPAAIRSRSPENSPPPALPSKKGRFFGFGLRASSSAYPLSKHDKKHRNEPRVDSAFRITSEDYTSATRTTGSRADVRAEMSDFDVQTKLGQLRDMGFTDAERNTNILRRLNGDVERTIEALVKLGPSEKKSSTRNTPEPSSTKTTTSAATPSASQASANRSNNPFDQLDKPSQPAAFGLSMGSSQEQQPQQQQQQSPSMSTNPWQAAVPNAVTGIEQSFSNMQVSQQQPQGLLFNPNMPPQDSRLQTMTPPTPSVHQQYGISGSPNLSNNPFVPLSAHSTGSNPWAAQTPGVPSFAPSTNPFLLSQSTAQQPPSSISGHNPFGLPPSNSPPQNRNLGTVTQQPNIFDGPVQQSQGVQQYVQPYQMNNPMMGQQQQYQSTSPAQNSPGLPNFQYGQPQVQQYQQYQQYPNLQQQQSPQYNPFFQQQQSPPPQQQYYQPQQQQYQPQSQFQSQPSQLVPQQTGRYDKNSILALYGAPQQPLASIPEPGEDQQSFSNQPPQPQQQHQQPLSPAPTNPYSSNLNSAKRASTLPSSFMPTSSMTNPINSPNSILSRNPFMTSLAADNNNPNMNATRAVSGIPQTQFSHSSAESISVNNATLMDGRHSPDAFASLSARYMR